MQLTTKGRYAVMAILDLAINSNSQKDFESQKPCSLQDISKRQEISLSYLEQLFIRLKKSGIVKSIRGAKGGYVMAQNPQALSVAKVIYAAEENIKITRCGSESHNSCMSSNEQCLTHELWEGLESNIKNYLENITLGQLIAKKVNKGFKYDFINNSEIITDFTEQSLVC